MYPWAFLATASIIGVVLLFVRSSALAGVPPHRLPSFDQAWTNWTRAFNGAFRLVPAKRPWQSTASWFATLAPLAAIACWRLLSRPVRFALAAGVALALLFELPFAYIVKPEQLHVVATGAALTLTAAITGLLQAASRWRVVAVVIGLAATTGVGAMAAVARDITRDFEPFGAIVMHADTLVEGWAAVPDELREYLAAKRAPGAAGRLDANPGRVLPSIAFGLHGMERSPDGLPLRWMAGPAADIFVRRGIRLVSFGVRHERGAFREPAHVRIEADDRVVADTMLDDGRWHEVDVPLRQRAWTGLADMHRIHVQLDHAWIPAKIIAGSGDGRTLGLQIGVIETR